MFCSMENITLLCGMEIHSSHGIDIMEADDILAFIYKTTNGKNKKKVFNTIALPMYLEYINNPVGKDYIAFNETHGFCFLAKKEIVRLRKNA